MSDNLEALVPGGTIVAAAIGLLGWFVRNSRDDRAEWKEQLKSQREQYTRDLTDERERHLRELSALERTEADLRRRLADDETVIAGLKDQVADQSRELAAWRVKLPRSS